MRPAPPPRSAWPPADRVSRIPDELLDRFTINAETGCWIWQGYCDRKGYGRLNYQRHSYAAHRAVYERRVGPIPDGLVLDHLCRVTSCVNPEHMEPVTVQVNVARGCSALSDLARARLSGKCINGHDIHAVGVHRDGGAFGCAQCGRDRVRRYKNRKRAERAENAS